MITAKTPQVEYVESVATLARKEAKNDKN